MEVDQPHTGVAKPVPTVVASSDGSAPLLAQSHAEIAAQESTTSSSVTGLCSLKGHTKAISDYNPLFRRPESSERPPSRSPSPPRRYVEPLSPAPSKVTLPNEDEDDMQILVGDTFVSTDSPEFLGEIERGGKRADNAFKHLLERAKKQQGFWADGELEVLEHYRDYNTKLQASHLAASIQIVNGHDELPPLSPAQWLALQPRKQKASDYDKAWLGEGMISTMVRWNTHEWSDRTALMDALATGCFLSSDDMTMDRRVSFLEHLAFDMEYHPGMSRHEQSLGMMPSFPNDTERLVLVVNTSSHWVTVVVDSKSAEVVCYNSWPALPGRSDSVQSKVERLIPPLVRIIVQHSGFKGWPTQWTIRSAECTLQDNAHDCGILAAYNCRQVLRGAQVESVHKQHAIAFCEALREQAFSTLAEGLLGRPLKHCRPLSNKFGDDIMRFKVAAPTTTPGAPRKPHHQNRQVGPNTTSSRLDTSPAEPSCNDGPLLDEEPLGDEGEAHLHRSSGVDRTARLYQRQHVNDLNAQENIYRLAQKQTWMGTANPAEAVLRRLLEKFFGGPTGDWQFEIVCSEKSGVEAQPGVDEHEFRIQRDELVTISHPGWYADAIVTALLRSHFPLGEYLEMPSGTRTLVADPIEVTRWMTTTDEDLQTLDVPFLLDEQTRTVATVFNKSNLHWLAFRADKGTCCIQVWDSLLHEDEQDAELYGSSVQAALLRLFNVACRREVHHQSWTTTAGRWRCEWMDTYIQRNTYDCGPLAVHNIVTILRHGEATPYADAKHLRYRHAMRLEGILEQTLAWGDPDPCAEDLFTEWQMVPAPTAASKNLRSGAAIVQSVEAALEFAKHATLAEVYDSDWELTLPTLNTKPDWNWILHAILRDGPLHEKDVKLRVQALFRKLGHTFKGFSKHANAWLRRADFISKDSNDMLTLVNPNKFVSKSALALYGSNMDQFFDKTAGLEDDIPTRPRLAVYPVRHSQAINRNHSAPFSMDDKRKEIGEANMLYWYQVHGGRGTAPRQIESAEDLLDTADRPDQDVFWVYGLVRSSGAPVFQNRAGCETSEDQELRSMLELLDEASSADERLLVTFVVYGVDGWTTDVESLAELPEMFPNLDLRLTMAMPPHRMSNVRHVFKERYHVVGGQVTDKGLAWAHFDLKLVAEVASALRDNSETLVQWQLYDQTALIHILRQAGEWKAESNRDQDESGLVSRREGHRGGDLMYGLQRNTLSQSVGSDYEKTCIECGTATAETWYRGSFDAADVVCDGCSNKITPRNIPQKGVPHKPWTKREVHMATEMRKEGAKFKEIGVKLGRSTMACRLKVAKANGKNLQNNLANKEPKRR